LAWRLLLLVGLLHVWVEIAEDPVERLIRLLLVRLLLALWLTLLLALLLILRLALL
jgi:hypothetical protein